MACFMPPTHFAVTLSIAMYTLIPTVYRALLKSAVSGIGHRIHTTKKMACLAKSSEQFVTRAINEDKAQLQVEIVTWR